MTAYDLALAEVVRAELARHSRSCEDLAREVGLSTNRLRARLHGRTAFSLPEFFAIASAFAMEPQHLLDQAKDRVVTADHPE